MIFPFASRAERVVGRAAVESRFLTLFQAGTNDPRLMRGEGDLSVQSRGDSAVVMLRAGEPAGAGPRTLVFVEERGSWKRVRLEVLGTRSGVSDRSAATDRNAPRSVSTGAWCGGTE